MLLADGANAVTVGYEGSTARIAAVHHFGAVDAVSEGGPRVRYPARPLLAISGEDRTWIHTWLFEQFFGSNVHCF